MLTTAPLTVPGKNHPANKSRRIYKNTLFRQRWRREYYSGDILSRLNGNCLMVSKRNRRGKTEEVERKRKREKALCCLVNDFQRVYGHLSWENRHFEGSRQFSFTLDSKNRNILKRSKSMYEQIEENKWRKQIKGYKKKVWKSRNLNKFI